MSFKGIFISLFCLGWGLFLGRVTSEQKPTPCPKTLPTAVTDMFTIQNDTLYLKQGVDFVISTKIGIVDSAGIIHRKNLHNPK
jgi:hypothetical protein